MELHWSKCRFRNSNILRKIFLTGTFCNDISIVIGNFSERELSGPIYYLMTGDRFTAEESKHMTVHHSERPDQLVFIWDH